MKNLKYYRELKGALIMLAFVLVVWGVTYEHMRISANGKQISSVMHFLMSQGQ